MTKRNKKTFMSASGERHDGLQIAAYRNSIGMSQGEFGIVMDVSQQTISNWEQTALIDEERYSQICDKLGIKPEMLRRFNPPSGVYYSINEMKDLSSVQASNCTFNATDFMKQQLEETRAVYKEQIDMLKDMLQSKDADITKLEARIDKLEALIAEKDQEIKALLAKLNGSK